MSRTLRALLILGCMTIAAAARADSFAASSVDSFRFRAGAGFARAKEFSGAQSGEAGHGTMVFLLPANAEGSLASPPAQRSISLPIPEPATLALLGTGLFCLAFGLRFQRRK